MERVGLLIDNLKEQFVQKANSTQLLITTQMLLAALQQQKNVAEANLIAEKPASKLNSKEDLTGWLFDMSAEIAKTSTVISQAQTDVPAPIKELLELNEALHEGGTSLNDHLKLQSADVSTNFYEKPVGDLKKAIGINDRYLFINELFRGDEIMYERSLKTINSFSIFPEAQYWIQRELKVKLSWKDQSEAVVHFDQLVKRRFASI